MNIKKVYLLAFILCLAYLSPTRAQGVYQAGLLPSINLNYKLNDQWSFNVKSESRQRFVLGTFGGEQMNRFDYVLTDMSAIAARKIGVSARIAGGYLIRFRNNEIIHRSIQQYTYVQNLEHFRLAHRVVADQTFSPIEATDFRFRYRLASEIPLEGKSADPKELYLKVSNEYLNSIQEGDYNLEIRIVSFLGYSLSKKQKIEFGLDYRVNSLLNQIQGHSFWTSLNWYINL